MAGRAVATEAVPWRGTKDAARYVGLGVNAFRAVVKRGGIAFIEDGGARRYLLSDLDAYLHRKRRPAAWEGQPEQSRPAGGAPTGTVIQLPGGINPITRRPYGQKAGAQ